MQNLLLLHLREQRRLTPKQIEQGTGIAADPYLEYEQGKMCISNTDAEVLSTLLKVKSKYLATYSGQLDFFSHASGVIELKDRRVAQLTKVLKRYIRKAPGLKPQSLKL